jgi:hypothetical protein
LQFTYTPFSKKEIFIIYHKLEVPDMKRLFKYSLLALFIVLMSTLAINTGSAENSGGVFMSEGFAKLIVDAWNNGPLPVSLGTKEIGGSDWINTTNKYTGEKRSKQVIIMSRRDCPDMPKVQLTIENINGKAVCTYGGALTEQYDKAEWAFAPTTVQWYKFASGKWGYLQMPGIMSGFRGPMFVARANIDNFGEFWKVVGRLAKNVNADYMSSCTLDKGDIEDIKEYLKLIK